MQRCIHYSLKLEFDLCVFDIPRNARLKVFELCDRYLSITRKVLGCVKMWGHNKTSALEWFDASSISQYVWETKADGVFITFEFWVLASKLNWYGPIHNNLTWRVFETHVLIGLSPAREDVWILPCFMAPCVWIHLWIQGRTWVDYPPGIHQKEYNTDQSVIEMWYVFKLLSLLRVTFTIKFAMTTLLVGRVCVTWSVMKKIDMIHSQETVDEMTRLLEWSRNQAGNRDEYDMVL